MTLKKLINLKPFQFEQHDFSHLHSRTIWLTDRFPSIDDLIATYNLTPKNVENMAQSILELKDREKGSFGMNAIQPNFVRKGKQVSKFSSFFWLILLKMLSGCSERFFMVNI